MSERTTRPAKEEDLIIPNGNHAMNPGDGTPYELHLVLVDGIPAMAGIDAFGGYSCLLYTSPSPRDATLSRMPSSA